ncbi:MAG TPA: YetF domain-containing protein [Polyangia bacterium]
MSLVKVVAMQAALALAYYAALVALFRLAGKRMAGQSTTFDLVVLIGLAVVLQEVTLKPGRTNAVVFLATVFLAHVGLAAACVRSGRLRHLVRGAPRPLIERGRVSLQALADEGLSYDELLAGLRKAGFDDPKQVRLAILEETGHISAVGPSS